MAEEVTIRPTPVETSEAPHSHLSAGEVAQPYEMLARSLDKAGDALEKVATPLAEQAGYQAVSRDEQGNIQVDRVPVFGEAGAAYSRAIKMAALAQGEGAAKRADIELREQYRDNPQGYQNAADAYKQKTVDQFRTAAGPEVANSLGEAIDNTTTMTYRGLLNEKERLDLERATNDLKAGRADARDDAMALARQGVSSIRPGMGRNALDDAINKYQTITTEMTQNPRLAYTPDQAARDMEKFKSELGAQRYLYHIDQTYKQGGIDAAENDAKDILTNPSYHLTDQERDAYYHRSITDIRASEAVRKQDVFMARQALADLRDRALQNQPIDPGEIDQVYNTFKRLNDPAGMAQVTSTFAHKDLHDAYGQQPLADQVSQLHTIRGAVASRDAFTFFVGKGYSREQAAGIVSNLVFESTLSPTATNLAGGGQGALGLAQWRGARFDALKAYASSQGKPWQDPQTQLEFIDRELRGSESFAGGLLRTATTPEQAAAAFSTAYERGEGRDTGRRELLARSIFEGKSADGSGGPGFASWRVANMQSTLKGEAIERYKVIKADFDNGKGFLAKDLSDVVDAARETGNIDLAAKAEQLGRAQQYIDDSKLLPLDQQAAIQTEIRRQFAEGKGSDGAELVEKQLAAKTEAIRKGLEENPVATAIDNFPEKFKTPPPLNVGDPQQFVAGLAQRAQIARFAAQNWRVPPVSALDQADVQTVKAALSTPDLAKRAAVWGELATLPDDVRGPTFEKIAKGDPNALASASAGSMMATDPDMAKSIMAGLDIMSKNDKSVMKHFEPKEGGEGFDVDLAKDFPASAFGAQGRFLPTGNYATTTQMIKARYAFLAATANDTNYSPERVAQAVNDVTGGMVQTPGGKTIAPARGMTQYQFDRVMAAVTDADLKGVRDLSGRPVTADFLRAQGGLEAIGQGKYLVNFAGAGAEKPIYAFTGVPFRPQRFVLDLSNRQPAPYVSLPAPEIAREDELR
jgi:hypothetical protein